MLDRWKALCALLLLAVVWAGPASAASYPNAVVLVSGVESTTPFTTPDPTCKGKEGKAWKPMIAPALRAAGVSVFTAPVERGGKSAPSCTAGGPDVDASETIDSNGEIDANGAALARFLSFIAQNYGVTQVQLVGHSDGGLWSRSAITLGAGSIATSLTTIGTPHTGSFLADVATHAGNFPCKGLLNKARCAAIRSISDVVFKKIGETAVYDLSSPFLVTWNPQQQIGTCPITVIAGNAKDDEKFFPNASAYYNPSDGLVGVASALNQDATALDGSEIPAASGLNIVTSSTFRAYHTRPLGKPYELFDLRIAEAVLKAIRSGSPIICAPASGARATSGPVVAPVQLWTASTTNSSGELPSSVPGDAIVAAREGRARCGRRPLESHRVRGHEQLTVTFPGRCRGRLTAPRGRALLLHGVRGVALEVVSAKGRVRIVERKGKLHDVRVDVRANRRWRKAEPDARGGWRLPSRASAVRISGRVGDDGTRATAVAFLHR